jgi:type IV fimbrial biogenesis protein FimT
VLISRTLERGISIIEVVITMAVLVILLSLGVPSFYEWIQNQQIRAAAEALLNGLQTARIEAIQRNVTVQFVISPPGSGWTVREAVSGTQIQARNAAEGTNNAVVTATPVGATIVTFAPMGGVTANSDASASITRLDVTSVVLTTTAARPLRIVISGGGSVRMCDPHPGVAATDPRFCT